MLITAQKDEPITIDEVKNALWSELYFSYDDLTERSKQELESIFDDNVILDFAFNEDTQAIELQGDKGIMFAISEEV